MLIIGLILWHDSLGARRVCGLHPGFWIIWICRRRDELARGQDALRPDSVFEGARDAEAFKDILGALKTMILETFFEKKFFVGVPVDKVG